MALLGAIALVALGRVSPAAAWAAVDVATIALLLGLMVVSAQFRLGGFYGAVTARLAAWPAGPPALLAGVVGVAGLPSALLANDIVCLAVASRGRWHAGRGPRGVPHSPSGPDAVRGGDGPGYAGSIDAPCLGALGMPVRRRLAILLRTLLGMPLATAT